MENDTESRLSQELATLRQHHGRMDTSADIGRLENGQFILLFFANDGHSPYSIPMATGSSSDQHMLPLCLELGASLPLSHLCYLLLDSRAGEAANELDDVDNAGGRTAEEREKNGRRTADERQKNGIRNLAVKPKTDAQQPSISCRALDTSADFRRWRIKQFSPVFFSNDGRVVVVYICHRFGPIRQ
jgi:hypothetical protein